MKLLHGSYIEINKPDLSKCKSHNDFGKGFYLTPNWKRAWQMGKRRAAFKADYLEEDSLKEFASRISQFGSEYIQYCFCTQRSIDELIKE